MMLLQQFTQTLMITVWVNCCFLCVTFAQSNPPANHENGAALVQRAESLLQSSAAANLTQALSLYRAAVQSFQANHEIEAEALSWHRIGQLLTRVGQPAQAADAAKRARIILRARTLPAVSDRKLANALAARALLTLGRIQLESGEPREAMRSYQDGLYLAGNAKLPREIAAAQVALGLLASQAEEYAMAIQFTTESIQFWREAKDLSGEAMALNNLARLHEKNGNLLLAAQLDEQSISLNRLLRHTKAEQASLNDVLRVYLALKNYDAAAVACEHLIGIERHKGNQKSFSDSLIALAMIELKREKLTSVYQLLLKALISGADQDAELSTQIKSFMVKVESDIAGGKSNASESLIEQANFEAKRGDYAAAYQLLLRALVANETSSSVVQAAMNMQIHALTKEIETRQKKMATTHP